jgi:hypothetical protein
MLVDQVVIDAEFGRNDNGSISHNCDQKELEPHDARTDPRTKLSSPVSQILAIGLNILHQYYILHPLLR